MIIKNHLQKQKIMAKQQRKQQIIKSEQGQGHLVEETFDDNLLPDASEIEKLQRLDPDIMEWLKKTTEKEQKFRHDAYEKRLDLVRLADRGDRQINRMGLVFSLIIVLAGMVFSAFLIYMGHTIIGSIFAGGLILSIIGLFLSKVNKQSSEK